jgi:hypothetical protein
VTRFDIKYVSKFGINVLFITYVPEIITNVPMRMNLFTGKALIAGGCVI